MNQLEIPDIKAKITVTGKDFLWSGCRPAHSGGLYLTTGLHTYIGVDNIYKNFCLSRIVSEHPENRKYY